jgi:hypothetical protein
MEPHRFNERGNLLLQDSSTNGCKIVGKSAQYHRNGDFSPWGAPKFQQFLSEDQKRLAKKINRRRLAEED